MTGLILFAVWTIGGLVTIYVIYFIRCRKYIKMKKDGCFDYSNLTLNQYINTYYDDVPDFLIVVFWPFSLFAAICNLIFNIINGSYNMIKCIVRKIAGVDKLDKIDD